MGGLSVCPPTPETSHVYEAALGLAHFQLLLSSDFRPSFLPPERSALCAPLGPLVLDRDVAAGPGAIAIVVVVVEVDINRLQERKRSAFISSSSYMTTYR